MIMPVPARPVLCVHTLHLVHLPVSHKHNYPVMFLELKVCGLLFDRQTPLTPAFCGLLLAPAVYRKGPNGYFQLHAVEL